MLYDKAFSEIVQYLQQKCFLSVLRFFEQSFYFVIQSKKPATNGTRPRF